VQFSVWPSLRDGFVNSTLFCLYDYSSVPSTAWFWESPDPGAGFNALFRPLFGPNGEDYTILNIPLPGSVQVWP